jgi:hypothetical protein
VQSSSPTAAAAQSFLQNRALSGSVFAGIGIVLVVALVFAASAFVRRTRQKRLLSQAVSFDPVFIDDGYHKDSPYGNAGPAEKDRNRVMLDGGSMEAFGRRSESSSGHGHDIGSDDAGYANFATTGTQANQWQYQRGYGQGYGQAPAYGGSGYPPNILAQKTMYGADSGPPAVLRPHNPATYPPFPVHANDSYGPRVPPALNTTPGSYNTAYALPTATSNSTNVTRPNAALESPQGSSVVSGVDGQRPKAPTVSESSHSHHGTGTIPVAAPLPDRFGSEGSPAPRAVNIPEGTLNTSDSNAVLSYNLRDFSTPPHNTVLKVNF